MLGEHLNMNLPSCQSTVSDKPIQISETVQHYSKGAVLNSPDTTKDGRY